MPEQGLETEFRNRGSQTEFGNQGFCNHGRGCTLYRRGLNCFLTAKIQGACLVVLCGDTKTRFLIGHVVCDPTHRRYLDSSTLGLEKEASGNDSASSSLYEEYMCAILSN